MASIRKRRLRLYCSLSHRASVAVLTSCILLTGGCQFLALSKEAYLERGNKLAAEGNDDEAALQYRKAMQKDARYGEAHLRFGHVLIKQNKNEEAYHSFNQAVALMPESEEAQTALGRTALHLLLGNPQRPAVFYQAVERVSKKLLAKNPQSFEGLRLQGFLSMADSKPGQAIAFFQKSLQLRPNEPQVTTVLVQNLLIEQRDGEAEKLARESLASIKDYGALYDTLYSMYIRSGRTAEAEQLLKSKITNNPTQAFYVVQLADHYQGQKKVKEVEDLLNGFVADEKRYPSARLEAGDFHRRSGMLEKAAALYQKGADSDQFRRKEYLQRLAGVRMEQSRNAEASSILDTILTESPNDSDAISSRASLRMATGKPEAMKKALEEFASLAQKKPDDEQVRFLLAGAYRQLGQVDKARVTLQELIKRNPASRQPLREMADIAIRARRADEALQYAEHLIEIDPNDVSSRLVRTSAWALQRRFGDVRAELRRITAEHPDLAEAWLQMATLNMEEKNYAEAERVLLRYYQPGSTTLPVLRRLVTLHLLRGQPQKALALLREKTKLPESPDFRVLLASTAAQAGDVDLALATVQKLTADFPETADHWTALGEIYLRQGLLDQSITSLRRAREAAPGDPHPAALLGSALGQAGRYTEAVAVYRQSLQLKPDDPLLMNNLAWHLALTGSNLDEATTFAEKALQKAPENSHFTDTIGMIYLKSKKLDGALRTLLGVVRKEPLNPEFRTHLAMVLIAQNQPQQARTELETALRNRPSAVDEKQIQELLRSLR